MFAFSTSLERKNKMLSKIQFKNIMFLLFVSHLNISNVFAMNINHYTYNDYKNNKTSKIIHKTNNDKLFLIYNKTTYMTFPCYIMNSYHENSQIICKDTKLNDIYKFTFNKSNHYSLTKQIKTQITKYNSFKLANLLFNHMDYFALFYPINDINNALKYLDKINEKSKQSLNKIYKNKAYFLTKESHSFPTYDHTPRNIAKKLKNTKTVNKSYGEQLIFNYHGLPFGYNDNMKFSDNPSNQLNSYNWYKLSNFEFIKNPREKITYQTNNYNYHIKLDNNEYEVFFIQSNEKTARFVKLKNQSQNDLFNQILLKEYDSSFLSNNYFKIKENIENKYEKTTGINLLKEIIANWRENLHFMKQLKLDSNNEQLLNKNIQDLNYMEEMNSINNNQKQNLSIIAFSGKKIKKILDSFK